MYKYKKLAISLITCIFIYPKKITYYDANIAAVKPDSFCVQKDYSIYPTTFELSIAGKYVELRANNEQA